MGRAQMIPRIGTTISISFYSTLIQSIIGVVLCALYVLFHFCAITVSCPGEDSHFKQVAFTFYTTYIRAENGCNISGNAEIMSNPHNLTQPNIIFFWQILLLLLYLAWVGTALLLQQMEKKSRVAIPWLSVTLLLLIVDFCASVITLTDFKYPEVDGFSCALDQNWSKSRRSWTIVLLFLFFSRGIFCWILNLWGFLTVTAFMIESRTKKAAPQSSIGQTSKNPMTELWTVPQEMQERELPDMNTFSGEETFAPSQQVPSRHYQGPTQEEQRPPVNIRAQNNAEQDGLRRPQSFVERVRNAENSTDMNNVSRDSQLWSYSNPGVRKELQSRGERHRPLHPDQDVDSAFNFLETYSVREEEGDGRRGYSLYLSSQKEESIEGLPSIPRVKVPAARPPSRGSSQTGPGSRYFVPLKK